MNIKKCEYMTYMYDFLLKRDFYLKSNRSLQQRCTALIRQWASATRRLPERSRKTFCLFKMVYACNKNNPFLKIYTDQTWNYVQIKRARGRAKELPLLSFYATSARSTLREHVPRSFCSPFLDARPRGGAPLSKPGFSPPSRAAAIVSSVSAFSFCKKVL